MESECFQNRFFQFGHSDYFTAKDGQHQDDFMRAYWVPLLTNNASITQVDNRTTPGALRGILEVVLKHSQPVKFVVVLIVVGLIVGWFYRQKEAALKSLAVESWIVAQNERNSSKIASAYFFLNSAKAFDAIWNKKESRDAILAAEYDAAMLSSSWVEKSRVLGCKLSPDGTHFVSWDSSGNIYYLCTTNSSLIRCFTNNCRVFGICFSPNGSRILSWGDDGAVKIWGVNEQNLITIVKDDQVINGATLSSDGENIITWDSGGRATVWDADSGRLVKRFQSTKLVGGSKIRITPQMSMPFVRAQEEQENEIYSAILSSNKSIIATIGSDATVRFWSMKTNVPAFVYSAPDVMDGIRLVNDRYLICWGRGGWRVVKWVGLTL